MRTVKSRYNNTSPNPKSKLQVFKYQRPVMLMSEADKTKVLVYNRARDIMGEFEMDEATQTLFEQASVHPDFKHWGGLKFYAYGVLEGGGKIMVSSFAPVQDW